MILYIILTILSVIPWIFIHEGSHLLAAKFLVGIKDWKIIFYPHRDEEKSFHFARSTWKYIVEPTYKQKVLIYLAPRLPNLICFLAIILLFFIPYSIYILPLLSSGLTDLIIGSIGYSPKSDLRKASAILNINPWILRIIGLIIGIIGMLLSILLLL